MNRLAWFGLLVGFIFFIASVSAALWLGRNWPEGYLP